LRITRRFLVPLQRLKNCACRNGSEMGGFSFVLCGLSVEKGVPCFQMFCRHQSPVAAACVPRIATRDKTCGPATPARTLWMFAIYWGETIVDARILGCRDLTRLVDRGVVKITTGTMRWKSQILFPLLRPKSKMMNRDAPACLPGTLEKYGRQDFQNWRD
ncbi:MAG: hypothetical protein ONB49_13085, partial [candidate division KSB1 bacterium]|nr:hypothetical protein [candidate division KSB1 bacterium]